MELRLLEFDDVKKIYVNYLEHEFTDDERKPLIVLKVLIKMKIYECYGLYEDDELKGYAFMCVSKDGLTMMLDYLEILAPFRGQGYGSKILASLKEKFGTHKYLVAEVESLEQATDEENLMLRKRRRTFYERSGFIETQLELKMFETLFNIYVVPFQGELDENELYRSMNTIYDSLYYDELIRTRVVLKNNN